MPRITLLAALAAVGLLLGFNGTNPTNPPVVASDNPAEFAISGPYTHENLSIFLLHGPDTLPPRNVLTLDEALVNGKAIVHETGSVNTLCVENLSDDSDLMMQNGDIVKGGRQDRVLRVAMILPPKSGPVAVESFCVEQGRWTNRGAESATKFGTNPGQISGKDLKMAVNVAGVQGEVWKNVAATQVQLSTNNLSSVTANASPTSLQLATENKELQTKLAAYRGPLSNILDGKSGVVGYAIAVNGKVTGAEVYGSSVLMAKAWKKAVDSAALEAFAEKKPTEFVVCRKDNVRVFLADAGGGANTEKDKTNISMPEYLEQAQAYTEGRRNANVSVRTAILPPIRREIQEAIPMSGQMEANITNLNGRSGVTRDRMLMSNGGMVNGTGTLTLTGTNTYTGATTISAGTSFQSPSTDVQIIPLDSIGGVIVRGQTGNPRVAPTAPAVQAPPVQVNRVMGTNGVLVESRDRANPGVIIHRTFIAK